MLTTSAADVVVVVQTANYPDAAGDACVVAVDAADAVMLIAFASCE